MFICPQLCLSMPALSILSSSLRGVVVLECIGLPWRWLNKSRLSCARRREESVNLASMPSTKPELSRSFRNSPLAFFRRAPSKRKRVEGSQAGSLFGPAYLTLTSSGNKEYCKPANGFENFPSRGAMLSPHVVYAKMGAKEVRRQAASYIKKERHLNCIFARQEDKLS